MNNKFLNTSRANSILLPIILISGLVIRIYKVEMPTLWNDELNHVLFLNKNWQDFFDLVLNHSTFYQFYLFLLKIVSYIGTSDGILRLPAVMFGTYTIYIVYCISKECSSRESSLFLASITAIHLAMIWFSRNALEYSMYFMMYALCMFFLVKMIKYNSYKNYVMLSLFSSLFVFIGIGSIVFVCIQLTAACLFIRLKHIVKTNMEAVIPLIPAIISIIICTGKILSNKHAVFMPNDSNLFCLLKFNTIADGLKFTFDPFDKFYIAVVIAFIFFVLGFLRLHANDNLLAKFLMAISTISVFALFFVYHDAYSYRHRFLYVFFLTVPFLSAGFDFIDRNLLRLLIIVTLSAGMYINLFVDDMHLYQEGEPLFVGFRLMDFKKNSKYLISTLEPGSVIVPEDLLTFQYLLWYTRQYNSPDKVSEQVVSPNMSSLTVNFWGHENAPKNDFTELRRKYSAIEPDSICHGCLQPMSLYSVNIARDPKIVLKKGTVRKILFNNLEYYKFIYRQKNVLLSPDFNGRIVPTVSGPDAFFVLKLDLPTDSNYTLKTFFDYDNNSLRNFIEVSYSFDDNQYSAVSVAKGVGFKRFGISLPIEINKSNTVYLKFKIANNTEFYENWAPLTAQICLRDIALSLCSDGDNSCATEAISSVSPTGFSGISSLNQIGVVMSNIIVEKFNSYDVYKAIPGATGVITAVISDVSDNIFFFPRVNSLKDSIIFNEIIDEHQHTHCIVIGNGRQWTDIGLRIYVQTDHYKPKKAVYSFILSGDAQLYSVGGNFLFSE
jgi:hypothetical protein